MRKVFSPEDWHDSYIKNLKKRDIEFYPTLIAISNGQYLPKLRKFGYKINPDYYNYDYFYITSVIMERIEKPGWGEQYFPTDNYILGNEVKIK